MFKYFKVYKATVERSTGRKLIALRSDNGTEYRNKTMKEYLDENGIQHQLSPPYTPQQNGVS